jgi:hypothetical protein
MDCLTISVGSIEREPFGRSVGILVVGKAFDGRADGLQVVSPLSGDLVDILLVFGAVVTSLGASVGETVSPEATEGDGVRSNPAEDPLEDESGMLEREYDG